ncbi:unnamed protein product [Caenorhabditis brenneri]
MNSFKLLFLPFLAFQRVIRVMDLIDVFELSQISKRMFAKIRLAKRKILPVQIAIRSEERSMRISDYLDREGEGKNYKLNFTFEFKLHIIKRELKGYNIGISEKKGNDELYPGFIGPFQDNFLDFLGKLLQLFAGSGIFLFLQKNQIPFIRSNKSFFRQHQCTNLVLYRSLNVFLGRKEVKAALQYTKPTQGFHLNCRINSIFNPKNAFNLPIFTGRRAWWVRIEHLLNMKCELCILENHDLTEKDMKRIVKHWLEGNLSPNFYRLGISKFEIEPDWKGFLEDVEYKQWDEKKRARYFM